MSHRGNDKGKFLAWLLRHGARERGLVMDAAGFAPLGEVLRLTHLSRPELDEIVAQNNKARFQILDERIRAVQGHSDGTPVTREGLEASWELAQDTGLVVHGTTLMAAESILRGEGLHSAGRSHVHLAPSATSVVGKRHQVEVLLVVDPARLRAAGFDLWRAPNGVLLARAVPRAAIVQVLPGSAAEPALAPLRRLLADQ